MVAAAAVLAMAMSNTLATPLPLSTSSSLTKRSTAPIITACTVPNSFAVTFDDGPSIWTHELLDFLATIKIKVTFFVNGLNYNLITDPEFAAVVKRAHDEGHQIASHTWAHADLSIITTDIASQMTMCKCNEARRTHTKGIPAREGVVKKKLMLTLYTSHHHFCCSPHT